MADCVSLSWRSWDDEFVVFDNASGDTHLLAPIAAEVMRLIKRASEPLESPQIVQRIAASLALELDDALIAHVQEILGNLLRNGLVQAVR